MNVKNVDRRYKADRLSYIVNRMRVRQDITPAHLAEELNVSERTIYRDLRSLESGSALQKRYSRREGRYLLENELDLPPLVLSPSQALALFSAASNPALSPDNFFAPDLRAALNKVAHALAPCADNAEGQPMDSRSIDIQAREGRTQVPHTSAVRASAGEKPFGVTLDSIQRPTMETLRRAMRSNCKVSLRYWPSNGEGEQTHIAAPYELRARREAAPRPQGFSTRQEQGLDIHEQEPQDSERQGLEPQDSEPQRLEQQEHWYLLANSDLEAVRTFKISRVRSVQILAERFRLPRHFSADAHFARAWETTSGSEEGTRIVVRFAPGAAALALESRAHQFTRLKSEPDGSVVCTACVNDCAEIAWWLLSYGDQAEALFPPTLREQFTRIAQKMAALYARPDTSPLLSDDIVP